MQLYLCESLKSSAAPRLSQSTFLAPVHMGRASFDVYEKLVILFIAVQVELPKRKQRIFGAHKIRFL